MQNVKCERDRSGFAFGDDHRKDLRKNLSSPCAPLERRLPIGLPTSLLLCHVDTTLRRRITRTPTHRENFQVKLFIQIVDVSGILI